MPSVSEKQRRTMAAAAGSAKFAKQVGIPQTVAREFNHADHLRDMKRAARGPALVRMKPGGVR